MKAIRSEARGEFYAFDPFLVDAVKCVLLRDGQLVRLTPNACEILLALVRHPDRVLEKEELFQLIWPDAFVDENNLPRNVSALRKALGEEPQLPPRDRKKDGKMWHTDWHTKMWLNEQLKQWVQCMQCEFS
jgi:DNA-binding response OmpR family regulator